MNSIIAVMTKTGLIVSLFAVMATAAPERSIQASVLQGINQVYAPELFGNARLVVSVSGSSVSGIVVNKWVKFRMVGTKSRDTIAGYFVQTAGPIIMDRHCPTCPDYPARHIPFLMSVHDGEFQGWIFFRGKHRKYCGGADFTPRQCLLQ